MNPQQQMQHPQITLNPVQPTPGQNIPTQDPTQAGNQAKANLGFINTMQEHLLQYKHGNQAQKQPVEAPQKPQNAPGQEKTPKQDNPAEEKKEPSSGADMAKEFAGFKTEIEGLLDSKIGDLKREIEMALKEDDKEDQTTKTA